MLSQHVRCFFTASLDAMSKLRCKCGHSISDNTNGLAYKASLLKDGENDKFFDWLTAETQSYVVAAQTGTVREWLAEKGYSTDYANLMLDHGNVLHDHIHGRWCLVKRDLYECEACGRIHIEAEDNVFASYASDNEKCSQILAATPSNGI